MNTRLAAEVAYSGGQVRSSHTDRWATAAGVAGMVGNVLLIMFFALAQPWRPAAGGLDWVGPATDAMTAVQFVALVPVAVAVCDRLGAVRLIRGATAIAVMAMGAVVLLQLMMLAGLLDFAVQGPLVTGCIAVTFCWVLAASRAGRAVLPRTVVRLGTAIGATYLIGAAVVGAGLLWLPSGSVGQYVAVGLGGAVGLYGWLGFPVWVLRLGRQVIRARKISLSRR